MRPELQDIVDEASKVLDADTTLEDREFNLVAYGSQRFDVDAVRQSSILQRRSSPATRQWFEQFGISSTTGPLRTPADPATGVRSRLCFPVRWRGLTYGYLWALDDATALDDPAVLRVAELAEHAATYLAQLTRQTVDDAATVADLLSSDPDKVEQAALRVGDRGLIGRDRVVVAVWVGAEGAAVPTGTSPNLWGLPRSVLIDRGVDATTVLVPLRTPADDGPARQVAEQVRQLWAAELAPAWVGRLVAGVGEVRTTLTELRGSWREARLAAAVAAAVPSLGPVARWADLGLYRLLAGLPRHQLEPLVLDPPVRRLLEADEELRSTVLAYLDRAGNAQDTAAALHIHRQTLYYRLNKVEALTGLQFSDGHARLRLHLALMLAPLL